MAKLIDPAEKYIIDAAIELTKLVYPNGSKEQIIGDFQSFVIAITDQVKEIRLNL